MKKNIAKYRVEMFMPVGDKRQWIEIKKCNFLCDALDIYYFWRISSIKCRIIIAKTNTVYRVGVSNGTV